MKTKKTGKTENRWSRTCIQAFLLFMILIITPGLMGMAGTDSSLVDAPGGTDSSLVDVPRGQQKSESILVNNMNTTTTDDVGYNRKTNLSLVDYAISRLGTGYVFGTYGQVLTESLLEAKQNQYPLKVLPHLSYIQDNWLGKPAQDCCGLIKGHYWTDDQGEIVYELDGLPDVSANGLYDAASEKGPIISLPEIKGVIVWKSGHVGIYIGNGVVIEARGTKAGVIKTRLTVSNNDTEWTDWFICPYIDYVDESGESVASNDSDESAEFANSIDSTEYTVRSGDTLWDIASELLGNSMLYLDIAELNNINDPDLIFTGQILDIPQQ